MTTDKTRRVAVGAADPGTSSPEHPREYLAAADLDLPGDLLSDLGRIGPA